MLSIGVDNLQFYPNFALFSTLEGMNLDHDFIQVSKVSEDQQKKDQKKKKKKKVVTKTGTLFPRIQLDTYAQIHTRVKLLGGMQM